MAKFERNPSGSFPEKTKNKLPDFPLLIYRYADKLGVVFLCIYLQIYFNIKFFILKSWEIRYLLNSSVNKCIKNICLL